MYSKQIPENLFNYDREIWLRRLAERMVNDYERSVFPLLFAFDLFDDKHIERYLKAETTEPIFKDGLCEKKEKIINLERMATFAEEDPWKMLRDHSCPQELTPYDEGFVFSCLPLRGERWKPTILKALRVQGCKIVIDYEILHQACLIKPTAKQQELYELLANFCEEFPKKNFRGWELPVLLETKNGKLCPNIRAILGVYYLKKE